MKMRFFLMAHAFALALLTSQLAVARGAKDYVPVRDVYVAYGGLTFHAIHWNYGRNETIVYLPGFADPGTTGDPILHRGEFRKYGILSIDPVNQGRSDHAVVADVLPYMNEVIRRFMDQEQIRRAYLIGHSAGALQILAFQDAYPCRVKDRVVLLDDGQISFSELPKLVFSEGNIFNFPPGEYTLLEVSLMSCAMEAPAMTYDECVAGINSYLSFMVEPTWEHIRKALLITRDFSIASFPGSEAADLAFRDASLAFTQAVARTEWIQIPGAGHNLFSRPEWANATAQAIADFLP